MVATRPAAHHPLLVLSVLSHPLRGDSRLRKWATLPTSSQVFVLQQIRDWVFGHYTLFNAPNAAWAAQDAEAYFWN
jgi:hypothetical protein